MILNLIVLLMILSLKLVFYMYVKMKVLSIFFLRRYILLVFVNVLMGIIDWKLVYDNFRLVSGYLYGFINVIFYIGLF